MRRTARLAVSESSAIVPGVLKACADRTGTRGSYCAVLMVGNPSGTPFTATARSQCRRLPPMKSAGCNRGSAPWSARRRGQGGTGSAPVRRRRCGTKFLRQTFHEFAAHSVQKSEWARTFYELKRQNHMDHHAAVRALAYKGQRILFRCWKDRTPYDEQIYLNSLQRRHSPVATQLQWKTVGGFQSSSRKMLDGIAQMTLLAAFPIRTGERESGRSGWLAVPGSAPPFRLPLPTAERWRWQPRGPRA